MNLLQLVWKNARQRALSTVLTLLSVALGTALGVALLTVQRGGAALFGQAEFGYNLIVGAKGGRLPLVLNTVYQLDEPPGTIGWDVVESFGPGGRYGEFVRFAVPVAAADELDGQPVLATTPAIFGYADDGERRLPDGERFEYRIGRELGFAQGGPFHARKFEAVLGSAAAEATGHGIGDPVSITHGRRDDGEAGDAHDETWTVVGILEPTGTALDEVAFLPLATSVAIDAHTEALEDVAELLDGEDHDDHAGHDHGEAPDEHAGHDHGEAPDEHAGHDHGEAPDEHAGHDHGEAPDEHAGHDHGEAPDEHAGHDHGEAPDEHAGHGHDDHASHEHDEHEHADEEHHDDHAHDAHHAVDPATGVVTPELPQSQWRVSAIMAATRGGPTGLQAAWRINNRPDAMAVNPAAEMRLFFDRFLAGPSWLLLGVTALVTVVAAVGILVSIYNSVAARRREVAILRSLGATRGRVLAVVTLEATLIGVIGALLGLLLGHLLAAAGSVLLRRYVGEGIDAWSIGGWEILYLVGVVLLAFLAGLVPALKAYQTPVAQNLSE